MRVKEVRISEHERFVICHNPEGAERDAAIRAELLTRLSELIAGTDTRTPEERATLRGVISTKPGLNRFLRVTPGGLLRIDRKAIAAESRLDGKYLLRCSDPQLSAEDIALGYKQLLEVERGWRDMKQIIDLRPVYHRLEDRIRAHVLLWPAVGDQVQPAQFGGEPVPGGGGGVLDDPDEQQRQPAPPGPSSSAPN
jgi:hypothetical protein